MKKTVLASCAFVAALGVQTQIVFAKKPNEELTHCIRGENAEPYGTLERYKFSNSCNEAVVVLYCFNDGYDLEASCGHYESHYDRAIMGKMSIVQPNSQSLISKSSISNLRWRACRYPQHSMRDGVLSCL